MPCATRYGENPYSRPATKRAHGQSVNRPAAHHIAVALPAKASTASSVCAASTPAVAVTGAASSPGSGSSVFHMRLTPSGATRCVLVQGERPWDSAYGVQPRNQSVCGASSQAHCVVALSARKAGRCPRTARSR